MIARAPGDVSEQRVPRRVFDRNSCECRAIDLEQTARQLTNEQTVLTANYTWVGQPEVDRG